MNVFRRASRHVYTPEVRGDERTTSYHAAVFNCRW